MMLVWPDPNSKIKLEVIYKATPCALLEKAAVKVAGEPLILTQDCLIKVTSL